MADQWTIKVGARVKVAQKLLAQPERMKKAGLLKRDLERLISYGLAAQLADREQKAELAALEVMRGQRKVDADELDKQEDQLQERLPMVIDDLLESEQAAVKDLGKWLQKLSFKRYRYTTTEAVGGAEGELLTRVTRTERRDAITRFDGLAAYVAALRAPGREAIVEALAERELSAEWLEDLQLDAEAVVAQGRNVKRAAEATAREEEAARAQRMRWLSAKRSVHTACEGDDELLRILADC